MRPSTFLTGLWGATPPGLIQIWDLQTKTTRCLTGPAMADDLAGGVDIYTAVCTVHAAPDARERGKGANLAALAGLWLDIDVDATKGAPTITAATDLAHAHATPTLLVASGTGVHAWHLFRLPWRLGNSSDRADAARAAAGWYALHAQTAERRGFRLDQSTRDLTRLLRIPGTRNGKTTPARPVHLLQAPGPRHDRRELFQLAATTPPAATTGPVRAVHVFAAGAMPTARLELLLDASPELAASFHHQGGRPGWSLSEWDMSLASQAAVAELPGQAIAELIVAHRLHHDPADIKHRRIDYLRRTITKAHANADRLQEQQQLEDLARQARMRTAA